MTFRENVSGPSSRLTLSNKTDTDLCSNDVMLVLSSIKWRSTGSKSEWQIIRRYGDGGTVEGQQPRSLVPTS